MKFFSTVKTSTNSKEIKKYKFVGLTFIKKEKSSNSRTIKLFNMKILTKNENYIRKDYFIFGIKVYTKNKSKVSRTEKNFSVSVIVPCYNHAIFLNARLDSIYGQTYKNFKVFLLDDCSTDNSREILTEYKKRYPEKTTLVFNEKNSGSGYLQWRKGLSLADGDLIWIAESDDYCDKNFLQSHIDVFNDDAVMLSFSPSKFIKNDKIIGSSSKNLADCISPSKWSQPFISSAHNFVENFLGKKNVVINVSSCIFRNIDFDILDICEWTKYRLCGDWILYLNLIAGGKVSYNNIAYNYYRIHDGSTSLNIQKQLEYYREHEDVAKNIVKMYNVSRNVIYTHFNILRKRFTQQYGDKFNFSDYYDIKNVLIASSQRKPNILMCCYALISGGGETFPISLANGLKRRGFPVTLLNFNGAQEDKEIRKRILSNVPIVHRTGNVEDIIIEYGIDIVHTHHGSVDETFATSRQKNSSFKLVVTQHGMYEMMDNFCERIQNRMICVDEWIYIAEKNIVPFKRNNLFWEYNFTKITNAVEKTSTKAIDRELYKIPKDAFIFCIASRGIPEKGWVESISAVTKAREISKHNIHLMLVGNGKLYEKLKDSSPAYVHFAGFQTNVPAFMAMSDMGLVASTFKGESVPLVILECYLVGKPVLSTNLGEVQYMLQSDQKMAGVLIDLDHNNSIPIDELANKMAKLASDKKYYNELKNNVPIVAKKFDYNDMLDKYISVYQKAFAK